MYLRNKLRMIGSGIIGTGFNFLLSALLLGACSSGSDGGSGAGNPTPIDQEAIIKSAIQESIEAESRKLTDATEITTFDTNVEVLVGHLMNLKNTSSEPDQALTKDDVLATISSGGGICFADERNLPCAPEHKIISTTFSPPSFIKKLVRVNLAATFSDSLKIAYYRVDNPLTGNDQLVVYDSVTEKQTVVKTNVILGNRAFVFEGHQDGDQEVITGKKYGIFLDPNQAQELRTAPDGRGGFFQYTFFFDNTFKRFDIASPSNETLIFHASMLSSFLKDQRVDRISSQYSLFNNTNDPDNSYVELAVFGHLPDLFKGETGDDIRQAPIVVRLVDGKMTQGRLLHILKDATTGLTNRVLINFEALHTPSNPTAFDERLQVCAPDLTGCVDVTGGAGGFYKLTKNNSHIYLAKKGSDTLFAFDQSSETLSPVSGLKYPALFDPDQHLLGAGGHGGGGILDDFSSIASPKTYLSDGPDAYLAINYDLDRDTKAGEFRFLGDIFIQKHSQILKFTGTNAVKMFDNGDGIDHGDASEAESAVGHANLIAVKNGKLFVEIANYDGISAGGSCMPNAFGYNCFSLRYGYLNTGSTGKIVLDSTLLEKENLRFMTGRRIAPVAMNDKLFVSILNVQGSSGEAHTYTLHRYDLLSPGVTELTSTVGRSYMTKTAARDNGIFEGGVMAWDSETKVLANVTGDILDLGSPEGMIAATGDSTAITSVFGQISGVPLAGIGNLVALKGMPDSHNWHLIAGDVNTENGLRHVDQVPTSDWLYE